MTHDHTLTELINLDELRELTEAFSAATGITIGIVDTAGAVLVETGWRRICTQFHRANPKTSTRCTESDNYIATRLGDEPYVAYKCKNGIWDVAVPIIIDGVHLASLFVGQFFYDYETIDEEAFRTQAREFGFDEADYMAALAEVPVYSKEQVESIMRFATLLVNMLSSQGLSTLRLQKEIARRKQTEDELETELSFIQTLLDTTPVPIYFKTTDGIYRKCNAALATLYGMEQEDIIGSAISEITPQQYADVFEGKDEELLREGGAQTYEAHLPGPDGTDRDVIISRAMVHTDGQPAGIIGVILDMTERVAAQREARRLRIIMDNTFNSMPSALVIVSPSGAVTSWNSAAESRLAVPPDAAKGQQFVDIFPSMNEYQPMLESALHKGAPSRQTKVKRLVGEDVYYEDITVFPLSGGESGGAVVRVDDVTERVRIDNIMIQTEKMMSVGGLAAGMAHEINNPLGIIMQCIQNMERRLTPTLPANIRVADPLGVDLAAVGTYMQQRGITGYISGIRDAATRAARIVRNMLDFSRKSESHREKTDVNALLDRTLELAASDYDMKKSYDFKQIVIEKDYASDLPPVPMVQTEIEQVVLNVLRNAAEAMSEQGLTATSRITLRTRRDTDGVRIEIADNGPGLDEKTQKRIFEPFYTTKAPGIGTGLGLSVSYFIISTNHGGLFTVESSPGQGATFIIRLPVAP